MTNILRFSLLTLLVSFVSVSNVSAFSSTSSSHHGQRLTLNSNRLPVKSSFFSSNINSNNRLSTVECWGSMNNDNDSSSNTKSSSSSSSFLPAATVALTAASVVLAAGPAISNAASLPVVSDTIASISGGAGTMSSIMDKFSETGFYQAFSLVFLSELGDKTFFIAGLLAMKTSKLVSFLGSLGALAVMTVISVLIGQIFHQVPAGIAGGIPLDDVAAVLAFSFFGFKTLKEALDIEEGEKSAIDEELEEAEEAVEGSSAIRQATAWAQILSTFGLVFAAEFGDRSFLATIALSAAQNPFYVAAGSVAAHGLATGIAVVSGSYLAKYISEKVIGIIGGTLFLVFAVTTALGIF